MQIRRIGSVLAGTSLLLAAVAGPALAAPGDHIATATGDGFALTVPMSPVGDILGGSSRASVSHAPSATASGVGFALVEDSKTEAAATSNGDAASEGELCGTDGLPAEVTALVKAGCSSSSASIANGQPTAAADATGLDLSVSGADVQVLLDTILTGIDEAGLGDALAEVEGQVLDPVLGALSEACLAGSAPLQPVFSGAADLLAEVERNLEENLPIDVTTLDPSDPCLALLDLTANPPIIGAPANVIDTLRDRLAAALSDATIIGATLGASDSSATTTTATVTADASAVGVDVRLPALDVAGTLVNALTDLVDELLTEVTDRVADVTFNEPGLPTIADLVDTLEAAIPPEVSALLADTEPLLTVTGGAGHATVAFDRASGAFTPAGTQAPLQVTLSAAFETFLETLLGGNDVPNPITVPEGGSQTIAAGTPLESSFGVGSVTTEDVERDGLAGKRVTSAGVDITLLKGLEGGIGLAVSKATAEVVGLPAAAPAVPVGAPNLPTTGGGLALLGLVAIGGAAALRRRTA